MKQLKTLLFIIGLIFSFTVSKGQEAITVNTANGTLTRNGTASGSTYYKWSSNSTTPQLTITLNNTKNNIGIVNTNQLSLLRGDGVGSNTDAYCTYNMSVDNGYVITGYSITGTNAVTSTVSTIAQVTGTTAGTGTGFPISQASTTFSVSGLNVTTASFRVIGSTAQNGVNCTSFTVTVEKKISLTYSLTSKISNTTYTSTVTAEAGAALAVPATMQRGYCSYTFQDANGNQITKVPSSDQTVYVNYEVGSLPFQFSEDITDPIYYFLKINSSTTTTDSYRYLTSATTTNASSPTDNNGKWAFIGDPYDVKIINKGATNTSYLSVNNSPTFANGQYYTLTMSNSGANDTWELYKSYSNENDFALKLKTSQAFNVFMNSGTDGTSITTYAATANSSVFSDGGKANFAAKSRMAVESPSINVTYNVVNSSGNIVATGTATQTIGSAPSLPNNLRRGFCSYGYDVTKITDNTNTVTVNYTVSGLPFEVSESTSALKYYRWAVNGNYIKKATTGFTYSTTADNDDASLWAFVGDPYSMKIYNKTAGTTSPLSETNSNILSMNGQIDNSVCSGYTPQFTTTDALSDWELLGYQIPNGAAVTDAFCLRLKGNNLYLYYPGTSNVLCFYKLADYINSSGQFYGSTYCKETTSTRPLSEVTYHIYINKDNTWKEIKYFTQNSTISEAPSLTSANKVDYCTYTYYSDETLSTALTEIPNTSTSTVYVKATFAGPFTVSTASSQTWYYMTLRSKYVSAIGPGTYPLTTTNGYSPLYQWAFYGNPYEGFKIVNRWYGTTYNLCNDKYGNRPGDNKYFNNRIGPSLTTSTGNTALWNLIKYNDTTFGFTSMGNPNMSLNDIYKSGVMGFFWWNAKLAIHSRMTVTAVGTAMSTDQKTTLLTVAKALVAKAGNVFALKSTATSNISTLVNEGASSLSDVDATTIENTLKDPDNYVKAANGYFRITTNSGDSCLTVNSSALLKSAAKTNAAYDAGTIFHLNGTDGTSFVISSQGLNVTKTTLLNDNIKMTSTSAAIKLWPLGMGRAAIQVADTTSANYKVAMYANTNGNVTLGTQTAHTAKWNITPVSSLSVAMHAPSSNAEGKSYATLYVPFDVTISDNTTAYTANSNTTTAIKCTAITANTIPAGIPVLLVNTNASVGNITMNIPNLDPTSSTDYSSNKFKGQYLSYTYSSDDRLFFGQGTTDGKAGFYMLSATGKTTAIGANKTYYPLTSGAKPNALLLSFDDATGIKDIDTDTVFDLKKAIIYDLQGRRIKTPSRGIYIVNGKKLYIK